MRIVVSRNIPQQYLEYSRLYVKTWEMSRQRHLTQKTCRESHNAKCTVLTGLNFQDALRTRQSRDGELMPFYLAMPSILEPTGAESRYGPGAGNKNERSERSVLLDLTADGDVFVPDRRLGRSRRLIDSFFPPFACVAPDQVLYFHLSLPPSLSLFRPTFMLLVLLLLFQHLLISFSYNLQPLPKSEGGTSRPAAAPSSFVFLSGRL